VAMCNRFIGSIHDQQPRMVTRLDGRLSYKLRRQFVVEITCFHEDIIYGQNAVCRMILQTIRPIEVFTCYAKPMTLPVLVSTSTCLKAGLEPVPGIRLISPETGQMNLAPV